MHSNESRQTLHARGKERASRLAANCCAIGGVKLGGEPARRPVYTVKTPIETRTGALADSTEAAIGREAFGSQEDC